MRFQGISGAFHFHGQFIEFCERSMGLKSVLEVHQIILQKLGVSGGFRGPQVRPRSVQGVLGAFHGISLAFHMVSRYF